MMPVSIRGVTCLLLLIFLVPTVPASAQRGSLIEDLFRSVADAQLEKERRKRAEAELRARQQPNRNGPSGVRVPNQPNLAPTDLRVPGINPNQGRSQAPAVNVRSREAADFLRNLVALSGAVDAIVADLRSGSAASPAYRTLLPEAYQLSADIHALIRSCEGLSTLGTVRLAYSDLDARWRQLSFKLRGTKNLSPQCTEQVRNGDRLVSSVCRQMGIEPQFDRHGLHDQMLIAATHMQTILDDLEIKPVPGDKGRLTHDIRLMRGRLLSEADRIEETKYEDVVSRFTEFVAGWGSVGERVYALNNPYLQRRLDRIRECGDHTYSLLWMPPPYNASSLTASAHRLEVSCGEILDQLTLRSMVSLDSRDQVQVMERSRRMFNSARQLEETSTKGASRSDLQKQFRQIDDDWAYLQSAYAKVPRLAQATLASIQHECGQIRNALGVGAPVQTMASYEELLQLAASLEGGAEYFLADILRYQRYLTPNSYRSSVVSTAQDFFQHAKSLHANISRRSQLDLLQREADHLTQAWSQLSRDLSDVNNHGLTRLRAGSLTRAQQELTPLVAQIAASLLE